MVDDAKPMEIAMNILGYSSFKQKKYGRFEVESLHRLSQPTSSTRPHEFIGIANATVKGEDVMLGRRRIYANIIRLIYKPGL